MSRSINVLALIKGEERYVFLFDDADADQLLQTLGQYAADPELSFSWYDAAVMSQRVARLRSERSATIAPARHRFRSEPAT